MTILDGQLTATRVDSAIRLAEKRAAHNYSPLPIVAASAQGAWITDVDGRRYLDCLSAYSAVNFGHRHPEIVATAHAQLDTVTLVSRAVHSDKLGPFCAALAYLCDKDMVLPMNSGAEAVESGLKVARKWGPRSRGSAGQANIIVADNNFHGRTISIVSFSSDAAARTGSAPSRRDSARCRSGMPTRWPRRSTTTPSRCCWSRSRVRPASSSRPTTTCRPSARCAASTTC